MTEIQLHDEHKEFELAQRKAKMYAASDLVPKQFQGNVANIMIAMNIANRLGADLLATMQSMYIVYNRPSFSSSYQIGMINASKRFTPLRYEYCGQPGNDNRGCRAIAKERDSGEKCIGTVITIGIAKAYGWYDRNGSHWPKIPEQMLAYRAASFWARLYAPDLIAGIEYTRDELEDIGEAKIVSRTYEPKTSESRLKSLVDDIRSDKSIEMSKKVDEIVDIQINEEREVIEEMWLAAVKKWGEDHAFKVQEISDALGIELSSMTSVEASRILDMIDSED